MEVLILNLLKYFDKDILIVKYIISNKKFKENYVSNILSSLKIFVLKRVKVFIIRDATALVE